MGCITIAYLTSLKIVDAIENGYKHTFHRLLSQQVVCIAHTFVGTTASNTCSPHQRTAYSHKDCSRNALTAHVGNDESDAALVDAEEIVEVASYVLCGFHRGCDVDLALVLWEWREDTW